MTEARSGWGGEFHLSTDDDPANYVELEEVVSFTLPDDTIDEIEASHLKSPGNRKEYIAGMIDGGDVTVEFNYVPGSDTDLALRNARDTRTIRAVKFGIPNKLGVVTHEVETFGFLKGYSRGPIEGGSKIAAQATFRITGAQSEGAA
jgi:hypothetical protein